jgi:hypothetical protein
MQQTVRRVPAQSQNLGHHSPSITQCTSTEIRMVIPDKYCKNDARFRADITRDRVLRTRHETSRSRWPGMCVVHRRTDSTTQQ